MVGGQWLAAGMQPASGGNALDDGDGGTESDIVDGRAAVLCESLAIGLRAGMPVMRKATEPPEYVRFSHHYVHARLEKRSTDGMQLNDTVARTVCRSVRGNARPRRGQ